MIPTDPRERMTLELDRLRLCEQDRIAHGDRLAAAMYADEIRHLERARAVVFDGKPLTPIPPGDHRRFVDDDEPPSLAQRHQDHFRLCNCLADGAVCCVAACECHDDDPHDVTDMPYAEAVADLEGGTPADVFRDCTFDDEPRLEGYAERADDGRTAR